MSLWQQSSPRKKAILVLIFVLLLALIGYMTYGMMQDAMQSSQALFIYIYCFALAAGIVPVVSIRKSRAYVAQHIWLFITSGVFLILSALAGFVTLFWLGYLPEQVPILANGCLAVGLLGWLLAFMPKIATDMDKNAETFKKPHE